MTKIFIDTNVIKNSAMENIFEAECKLANARSYFNYATIPNDFVNKKYLNWFNNEIENIQNSLYEIRCKLNKASYVYGFRHDSINDYIESLNKIQIKPRKGLMNK